MMRRLEREERWLENQQRSPSPLTTCRNRAVHYGHSSDFFLRSRHIKVCHPHVDIDSENKRIKCHTKEPVIFPPQGLYRHQTTTQRPTLVQIYRIWIIIRFYAYILSDI
jgi:hypothetical protein